MESNFRFADLCFILVICAFMSVLTAGFSTHQAASGNLKVLFRWVPCAVKFQTE